MTNRAYMQTLDDERFESVMYYLFNGDFDLADSIYDPTNAVLAWLSATYYPEDRIWACVEYDCSGCMEGDFDDYED